MIVRTLKDIVGTDRDVDAPTFKSRRLVLAKERVGFSLHDTILYEGSETAMWYANHIEAVYCVEGTGELVNQETGEKHWIEPGTMYLLDGHEHHTLKAITQLRMVCVFNPPVTGREVHDENGVYPLIVEPEIADATIDPDVAETQRKGSAIAEPEEASA
ncbi:MAG: ectoine synthase [Micromonosporaceae bacterium]